MASKRGQRGATPAAPAPPAQEEASVIEPDLQVFVRPEPSLATVTQLPVVPAKDRMSSLLERLERLELGLAAVGDRLDRVVPPDVRLVEAHDDPARMALWNDRHSAAAALPREGGRPDRIAAPRPRTPRGGKDKVAVSDTDAPDYLPDEVFVKLQKTVADRLRKSK